MSPEEEKESPEKEFAGNTTLHGLNRIVIAPSGYFRVLWVLAILSSYSGFAYMFSTMIIDYFSYDTITDTKLEFDDEVIFPAVTICNMNKFDESKLKIIDFVYLSMFLYAVQLDVDTIIAGGAIPDETVNSTTEGMNVEDLLLQKGFDIHWNRMPLCIWKGVHCTERNFTHSFGHYGNCYTFNADADNPLKQSMQGSSQGFMAFIDLKVDEYTETYTAGGNAEVGLKLLVHDPREPPMMDTQGIALAPGNHAFVSVKRILYENHVPPWGVCEDRQLEYYDTYTLNGCYLECRSKHVVSNCSCRPYNLPGTAPTCDPTTMFTCVNDVLDQVIRGELKCDCPVPCRMTSYSTSVSYAGWPNRHTRTYLAPYWGMDSNYITANGVVFSVFYEKLNYQKITELKAMDGGQLASNIGGMMGLFIGASLLTLLEVWEYLWQRLKGFLGKHRRPTVIDVKTQPHDIERGIVFHK
ncbi:acid-sensing ion channel 1C-like [Branchiostoma floridae]|uniref:Acid-sensing ion channel 1C-like n=1 Tax=Branchiostoma floridae TaxID=7739 RepID=A0A9J7MCW7_BRAFL|nr:acid-sensing ion channel 1C-like [Branchiostoma floridae]